MGRLITETITHFPDKENYQFVLYSHLPLHESHAKISALKNVKFVQGKGFLSKKGALFYNIYLPLFLRKNKIDLFWGAQQVIPPFLPKIPVVMTFIDLVLYLYPDTMRFLARVQQRIFQSNSIRNSDYILSISEQTRQDMIAKFQYPLSKTGVAYPGVDTNEIASIIKNEVPENIKEYLKEPYFLAVSTIEPRKNYSFLLNAYREYRNLKKEKHLKLLIAGKIGWEKEEFLLELKKDMETFKDIVIIENANDIALHHLYKNAGLFLFSSHYEGFGIPLLEALAHKRQCLVSDIPTFHEIGGDKIHYLNTESALDWALKMNELISNPKEIQIDLEPFTWKRSAEITKNAFDLFLKK